MAMPAQFDPLIDLDGMWTTELADRYLPLPELPFFTLVDGEYQCTAEAVVGQRLQADQPFVINFDPRELLP